MASKEVGADTPGQRAAKKSSKGAQAKEDELKKKEKKQKESKHKDNKENKENREKKEKKEKDKKEHKGKREKNKAKKDKKRKHNLEKDPDTLATGEDELDRLGDGADGSGDEEANLWDSIGAELPEKAVVETPAAATAGVATVSVATPDPTAEAQTVKGDYVIQVDAELRQTMAEKVKIIEHIVEGTQLVLEAGALQIFGPPEAQTQANHCANAVLKNRVHEGCADVSTVHVLPEWVDAWDGQKALEEELNVLIVFERLSGRGAFPLGQLAGLPWVKWSRTGEEIELYQPVVVRKFSPGGGKVKVTWCWDGLLRDEDASKLQAAVRVHIIGKLRDRGEALLRVLTLADQKAVGLMACQMETLTRRSDICGCDGGPGGMGLQEFDLGFDQRSLKRFWGNNGSELVDLVTKVSRCVTLSVYERPTAVSESYSRGSKQHIIALGTRKQRWMAAELLRMIVYTTIEKWLGRVPAKLGGECCRLTLPGQALTQFFGYRQRHYRDLMHETNTIIVPVQQNKGGIEKKDIDEVEDFIANMMEADDPFEIAIFGEPLAQSIVLVKLYALVERKVPGFVIRSGQSEEQIDPSDGVGIDKIRLTFDFQEDATNKKAEILSEAAGCYAACIGNLLLLAGHLKNRQRAREYAQFLAPKQRTTGGKFPYVHDVDVRADMMATWVPEDASKSKWFKDRLKSLMEEGKMCAFFDDCTNDNGERRLIFAGIRVENEEEKEAVMEVVTKTQDLAKDAVDWIHERYKSIDSSQEWSSWKRRRTMVSSTLTKQEDKPSDPVDSEHWNQGREENSTSLSSWSSWSNWQNPSDEPTSASSGLRVPQTPAGFGPHGNTAPQTPMPAARGAPRTPAGFGPYGLSAPQTPALPAASAAAWRPKEPDSRAAVPPPATPARPVPEPATPARSIPPPATPARPLPATPAPNPNPDETLPPGWQKCTSRSGKSYYFNARLVISQYERPDA